MLYRLKNGGGVVESVIIPSNVPNGRTTVCISSQLGCAMNCQFCFTAKMGLRRNLTATQIAEQVVNARRITGGGAGASKGAGARDEVTNVVFMGMGEPLHNVEAVLAAVDILTDTRGLAFSQNKVTVSTSVLCPRSSGTCASRAAPRRVAQRHHRRDSIVDHANQPQVQPRASPWHASQQLSSRSRAASATGVLRVHLPGGH